MQLINPTFQEICYNLKARTYTRNRLLSFVTNENFVRVSETLDGLIFLKYCGDFSIYFLLQVN